MAFVAYEKTRATVTVFTADVISIKLLKAIIDRVHALELFYFVGSVVRDKELGRTPGCIIGLSDVRVTEQSLAGAVFSYDYVFEVSFLLKHPNDSIILQQALYLEDKLRVSFSKGDASAKILVFGGVTGHYNTQVESGSIGPIDVLSNNVLAFSSGISIVCSVWRKL